MFIQDVTSPPPQTILAWGSCLRIKPIMAKAHRAWLMKLIDMPTMCRFPL
jgi:hypothetical protein